MKTQVWIAISVYVLVAIIKKRLKITSNLYTILQILSLTLFEKRPLIQMLNENKTTEGLLESTNQLNLFDNFPGH